MTSILVMETIESLATVKARLSEFVESAQRTHERVVITKNGRPAALLIGVEDYESLMETLEILSQPGALEAIREGEDEYRRGEFATLDEVRAALAARADRGT